ncbi:MAG: cysteine desulfurase family protein [Oscillospiraceae bacterium]
MLHYLDNASTTQVAPEVAEAISAALLQHWANPSALYTPGMAAEAAIQHARHTLADGLGCQSGEVFFTGCGTEGNNIAIFGAALARRNWGTQLVATGYEHPSVSGPLALLAQQAGFQLTEIAPGQDGQVPLQGIVDAVGPNTALVCAMHVNNETGALLDVTALAEAVKQKNHRTFVHVDGIQAFGKLPLALSKTKIDSYTLSGHKIHAPKGVGALYLRQGANLLAPIVGGGQEKGIRPGTENTPYIVGLGVAAQLMARRHATAQAHQQKLRQRLLAGLAAIGSTVCHSPENGVPGIVFFSMPRGLQSQVMINHLFERHGVCVSGGSACAGGAASHTLTAMGVPRQQIEGALRVSFCGDTTEADVDALLTGLQDCVATLARK